MRSAADQIVKTLPAPTPARLANCVAFVAPPKSPPVVRIDEPGPYRGRFDKAKTSNERERRKDNAEQSQLQLSLQHGHGHQANVEEDEPVGDRPAESVSRRVGTERERRQSRKREEGDRRHAGVDRETTLRRPVNVV